MKFATSNRRFPGKRIFSRGEEKISCSPYKIFYTSIARHRCAFYIAFSRLVILAVRRIFCFYARALYDIGLKIGFALRSLGVYSALYRRYTFAVSANFAPGTKCA